MKVNLPSTTVEQKSVIEEKSASVAVISCPGSGKTYTTALRMAYRLKNWKSSSSGIALLSHTNVAVKSFEKQFQDIGYFQLPKLPHFVGTLDGFITRFLIANYGHVVMKSKRCPVLVSKSEKFLISPKFKVMFSGKKKYLKLISELNIGIKDNSPYLYYSFNGKEILPNNQSEAIQALYSFAESGFYTHDHARYWGLQVLKRVPRLREILSHRFPEIIVDEAQDTSFWQQLILCDLEKSGSKLMLVGDPEQSIYEFNLGSSNHLADHANRKDVVQKRLLTNFRSNQKIVSTISLFSKMHPISFERTCSEEWQGVYLIEYSNLTELVEIFHKKILSCGLLPEKSTVIARSRDLVNKLRGNFNSFNNSNTHKFARAALERDCKGNLDEAYSICKAIILDVSNATQRWYEIEQEPNLSELKLSLRIILWEFVRNPITGLPYSSLKAKSEWYPKLKIALECLYKKLILLPGLIKPRTLWNKVPSKGLNDNPFITVHSSLLDSSLRIDTVHGVKGETFDATLYVVTKEYLKPLLNKFEGKHNAKDELVKIGYVALSRPKHLLWLAVPKQTTNKDKSILLKAGFQLVV